jgi:hypothetical protein
MYYLHLQIEVLAKQEASSNLLASFLFCPCLLCLLFNPDDEGSV